MNQSSVSSRKRLSLYARLKKTFLSEFLEAILAAAVVAMLLRVFIVSVYRVPSESMMPTLQPGDFIVAWKTSYGVPLPFSDDRIGPRDPERRDVVIFHSPEDGTMFVKRVVAVAGDRIEIKNGSVFINETEEALGSATHQVMKRPDATEPDFLAPLVVPPGHVFLLGDFRSDSFDSRQWGPVPVSQVVARAALIGFSFRLDGPREIRFERTLKRIE